MVQANQWGMGYNQTLRIERENDVFRKAVACLFVLGVVGNVGEVQAGEIGILRQCSFGAFVTETGPAGLNVRSGPGEGFPVVGKLPPVAMSADTPPIPSMVEVKVVAAQGGWFRIRHARDNEQLLDGPARPMFKGAGWVSGRYLAVKSQATAGRDMASRKGKAIQKPSDADFDSSEFVMTSRLLDCVGGWAYVTNDPRKFTGWLDRLCPNQETSCDGV